MGQGTQALRLARAGHLVTGLEPDPGCSRPRGPRSPRSPRPSAAGCAVEGDGRETGGHFLPGSFDVVLCHGVLMYVEDPEPMLAGLARVLAPGGLLSLLVRNGDALAMRPGLAGDWQAALGSFDTLSYSNRLGLDVRADRLEPLTATLAGIGVPLHAWYGVRVFTDAAGDDAPVPPARRVPPLLAAEERAGRTEPYRAGGRAAAPVRRAGLRAPARPLFGGPAQAGTTGRRRQSGHGCFPCPFPLSHRLPYAYPCHS